MEMKKRTKTATKKRFQKNCIECTRAHGRCVFELMDDVQCARCLKFHLTCVFRLSGMIWSIVFCCFQNHFLLLINKCHLPLFCNISEQGHRNDILIQQNVEDNKATSDNHLSSSIIVSSDSVHCNPLTQCTVSSGLSCHTTANSCEKEDVESCVGLNCIPTTPSWVHVFAKLGSTTSLRTQCAAAASMDVRSPKVFHRRLHCAKKRQHKIDEILREVIVPPNQF